MSFATLIRHFLVAALLFSTSACVTALPPTVSNPTAQRILDDGETAADLGVSALYNKGGEPAIEGNAFGGDINGHIEHAVSDRFQVGVEAARTMSGPSYTLSTGYTLLNTPTGKIGLTVGLTGGIYAGDKTSSQPVLDENGNPVPDENGNPTYEEVTTPYRYMNLAPAAGVRGNFVLNDHLDAVYHARLAYARTFNLSGLEEDDMDQAVWADGSVGLVGKFNDRLSVGGTVGLLGQPTEDSVVVPTVNLSARYTFGQKN